MKLSFSTNLDDLNFNQFLENGFIFQEPASSNFWLGVLAAGTPEDHLIYHVNFYQSENIFFKSSKLFKTTSESLVNFFASHLPTPMTINSNSNADDDYLLDVENSIKKIKETPKLQKLVTVASRVYDRSQTHPLANLKKMLALEGSIYGIWGMGIKNVLGVTPEPLFQRFGNSFNSVALAGTISTKEADFENKILSDNKERVEHDLVIEDIAQKLDGVVENFDRMKTRVIPFGAIAHLETQLKFTSNKKSLEIVRALSPTAALGGFPTKLALDELKEMNYFKLEGRERSFGGVYGIKTDEVEFALVGIRNLYWDENCAVIHSGGGIVASSIPERELLEIQRKRHSIEEVFLEQ